MPTIGKISTKENIPVVTADATMVKLAGVATVGINYEDLGRQTGKLAVQILKGKKVSDPVSYTHLTLPTIYAV